MKLIFDILIIYNVSIDDPYDSTNYELVRTSNLELHLILNQQFLSQYSRFNKKKFLILNIKFKILIMINIQIFVDSNDH